MGFRRRCKATQAPPVTLKMDFHRHPLVAADESRSAAVAAAHAYLRAASPDVLCIAFVFQDEEIIVRRDNVAPDEVAA